jgi:hypothetical protein
MRKVRLNTKAIHKAVADKHAKINVGQVYFLSNFYDVEGATVRVVSKCAKKNSAGWYSTVNVEILESDYHYYKVGETHTVNATNLYEKREFASASHKFGQPLLAR